MTKKHYYYLFIGLSFILYWWGSAEAVVDQFMSPMAHVSYLFGIAFSASIALWFSLSVLKKLTIPAWLIAVIFLAVALGLGWMNNKVLTEVNLVKRVAYLIPKILLFSSLYVVIDRYVGEMTPFWTRKENQ